MVTHHKRGTLRGHTGDFRRIRTRCRSRCREHALHVRNARIAVLDFTRHPLDLVETEQMLNNPEWSIDKRTNPCGTWSWEFDGVAPIGGECHEGIVGCRGRSARDQCLAQSTLNRG